jgi:hypothetical protein
MTEFQLIYSTMFAPPPPELHEPFDQALERVNNALGREFQVAGVAEVDRAMLAKSGAFTAPSVHGIAARFTAGGHCSKIGRLLGYARTRLCRRPL